MLGRKAVFGRHRRTRGASAPIPDVGGASDQRAQIFPPDLWDDPRIGKFLRAMGLSPDDPDNLLPDPEHIHRERVRQARAALDQRIAAFAAVLDPPVEACRIAPFLLVDLTHWRGRFGDMLSEQMALAPWDEWNVVLLADDAETARSTGLAEHPGAIPALNVRVAEALHAVSSRLEADLAACQSGYASPPPARRSDTVMAARDRFLAFVAICRSQVEALLEDGDA